MIGTEIVNGADQIHPGRYCGDLPGQSATPSDQAGQALPEGGVQPFDVGGIDPATALGLRDHHLGRRFAPLHQASGHAHHPPVGPQPFDQLFPDVSAQVLSVFFRGRHRPSAARMQGNFS
ncbi:MAG: hypothetical protein ABIN58_07350 [candidate division WOR-3 bacterium]